MELSPAVKMSPGIWLSRAAVFPAPSVPQTAISPAPIRMAVVGVGVEVGRGVAVEVGGGVCVAVEVAVSVGGSVEVAEGGGKAIVGCVAIVGWLGCAMGVERSHPAAKTMRMRAKANRRK